MLIPWYKKLNSTLLLNFRYDNYRLIKFYNIYNYCADEKKLCNWIKELVEEATFRDLQTDVQQPDLGKQYRACNPPRLDTHVCGEHTGPGATASTSPSHPHFSITFGERVFVSLRQRKILWWTVTIDMLSKESAKHSTMKGKYVPKKRHPGQCARRNWGAKIRPARRQPPQSGCPGPAPAPAVLSSRPPLLQFPLSTVIILLLHHLHLLSG